MKTFIRILIASLIGIGPAFVSVWLLFGKLAPYIVSVIPNGEYHKLFGVLVYIAIALLGGIEIPIICLIIGFMLANLFIVFSEGTPERKFRRRF
jgi:hypothetical protein